MSIGAQNGLNFAAPVYCGSRGAPQSSLAWFSVNNRLSGAARALGAHWVAVFLTRAALERRRARVSLTRRNRWSRSAGEIRFTLGCIRSKVIRAIVRTAELARRRRPRQLGFRGCNCFAYARCRRNSARSAGAQVNLAMIINWDCLRWRRRVGDEATFRAIACLFVRSFPGSLACQLVSSAGVFSGEQSKAFVCIASSLATVVRDCDRLGRVAAARPWKPVI